MARAAKQGTGSGGTAALVAAQSGTMKEFEKLARGRLGEDVVEMDSAAERAREIEAGGVCE